MKRIIFIAWAKYHRRSELLAQHFNAKIYYVSYGKKGRLWDTILKYPIQAIRTWKILLLEKPDVIFVQSPPIFCALVTYIYGVFFKSAYIIDSHTGAFLDPTWQRFLGLHRWLSRRALTTIVHNNSQDILINDWNCPKCVIAFTPGNYPDTDQYPFTKKLNVAVISTYGEDEPIDLVFAAANAMPHIDFYITGDDKQLDNELRAAKPENCHLTGYLSYNRYVGLLRGSHAIMDLTTRDHTLLMGGFEAISLGTPLITSNWPILKEYFSLGTVHVDNTIDGICEGVSLVISGYDTLKKEMLDAQNLLQIEWERKHKELLNLIQNFDLKASKSFSS